MLPSIHAAGPYGYTLRLFGFSVTVCPTKRSYRTLLKPSNTGIYGALGNCFL
jgi:hypothetical protein